MEELTGSGSVVATLLTGLGIDEVFRRTDANGSQHFLTDVLGSTLALLDGLGLIQTEYTSTPFGETTASGIPSSNPFQFTGRENDGTGLAYHRARYYHPALQRFISEDPLGFLGGDVNLYGYVGNDPVNWIDLLGLEPSPGEVASIIFNETRSLSGPDTYDARTNIGHAIFNGDAQFGSDRPLTAPNTANIPVSEFPTFLSALEAADQARREQAGGYDPTNGAFHFNFRNNASRAPFQGHPIQTQIGPLNNSFPTQTLRPTGIYANTYGPVGR